jgi:hypothetical protein
VSADLISSVVLTVGTQSVFHWSKQGDVARAEITEMAVTAARNMPIQDVPITASSPACAHPIHTAATQSGMEYASAKSKGLAAAHVVDVARIALENSVVPMGVEVAAAPVRGARPAAHKELVFKAVPRTAQASNADRTVAGVPVEHVVQTCSATHKDSANPIALQTAVGRIAGPTDVAGNVARAMPEKSAISVPVSHFASRIAWTNSAEPTAVEVSAESVEEVSSATLRESALQTVSPIAWANSVEPMGAAVLAEPVD